jgi:OTU-like cysteine protease
VPGDGSCLFHAISLCLHYAVNGTHWNLTTPEGVELLYENSCLLRCQAVSRLRQFSKRLFLQGTESLRAYDLVTAAAQQYDLTPEEYCAAMSEDRVWGGGPEIVALCNILQRPIHVYELATTHTIQQDNDLVVPSAGARLSADEEHDYMAMLGVLSGENSLADSVALTDGSNKPRFVLRRMACFGSPKFDRRRALHILSADSRFPDVQPGNQMKEGNHFFSVFPQEERVHSSRRKDEEKRKRLRGGEYADDDETYRTKKRKSADRTATSAAPTAAGSSILGLIFGGKDGGDHHEPTIRKPLSFWNPPEDEWLDHADISPWWKRIWSL